jgi:hypothetical protein
MPEPNESKTSDFYDRDLDDPYFIKEGKPTLVEKVMMLFTPVFWSVTLGRSLCNHMTQFHGFPYRYWRMIGSTNLQNFGYPWGYLTHVWQFKTMKTFGFWPGSYSIRCLVVATAVCHLIHLTQLVHHTVSNLINQYGNQIDMDQPADDYVNRWLGVLIMLGCVAFQCPRRFQDLSPYGVYCCSKVPNMIVGRNTYLVNLQVFFNYYISRQLGSESVRKDVFGQVVIPAAVFAWKRCIYFMEISQELHDCPWKGHAYIWYVVEALGSMNAPVSMQQINVSAWSAVVTYVIIDWSIYSLRMVIVARLGMKQCPKLITYLVRKQLENLPTPLNNHVYAKGPATSMRVDQAYVALMEGETMTMCYIMHFLQFAIVWGILRIDQVIACVPLRSAWLLLFYFGLDFIQDALADGVGSKFNHWSYIYKLGGWHSKRMLIFQINAALCWCGMWQFPIVYMEQIHDHRFKRMLFPCDWFMSSGGILHY